MKKLLISTLVLFSALFVQSQSTYNKSGRFYKTYQDYINNTPLEGWVYVVEDYEDFTGNMRCKHYIEKNGEKLKLKLKEYPTIFYTKDSTGPLLRIFDGDYYYVLVAGKLCYYLSSERISNYWSETITGNISKFSEGDLKKRLAEKGLKEQFIADKPKREFKDDVSGYMTKLAIRTAKYIKLYNDTE